MSVKLPFQIGWLNLWWGTLLIYTRPILIALLTGTDWRRARAQPELSPPERRLYSLWIAEQTVLGLYAIFVPLTRDPRWLYPGAVLFPSGLLLSCWGIIVYQTTPRNQLITGGIYRYSRNPGYFGAFLLYLGMGLLGANWLITLLALTHFALYQITTRYEERMCAAQWPEAFPTYRKTVAKNFLFF